MKTKEKKILDTHLNKRIAKNIQTLLDYNNINSYVLQKKLESSEKYTISYSYLNKILNNPERESMPLLYLIQCCQFFKISLDKIVSLDFTQKDCIPQSDSDFKKIIDSIKVIDTCDNEEFTAQSEQPDAEKDTDINKQKTLSVFIEDPDNPLFSSFLQTYYCYFYPTASSENKAMNPILSGTLTLEPHNGKCLVTLNINTKKRRNNKPTYKTYTGTAVISSTVQNIHCTLKSDEIGEFCYIIFRHFHLNYALQDCHMAAVLSTSSTGRDRYPTLLRMFLSREQISAEHLRLVSPHLWLNYSQIMISEADLLSLKESSEKYEEIINTLIYNFKPEPMYLFREDDVLVYAKRYLDNKNNIVRFITELRLHSYAYRYNKVSNTVESTVRDLLISLGYYQNNT